MSIRTSTFIFTCLLAYALGTYEFSEYRKTLEESAYPHNVTNFETLKEFVRLVEERNLNVSLIVSSGKNYEDGNLKEAMAMTITFPVNEESVTKPTLTKEDFDKLAEVGLKEGITVGGSIATNNKLKVVTNHKEGLPITKAYKIFTGIKNGKTGFVFDEKDYVAQYTFISPGADGKNHTTKVFHGDIDVEVVEKSENLKDDQVEIIKKAVVDALFTFEDEEVPRGIIAYLKKGLPEHDWDAATEVREPSYVDSDTWALIAVENLYYLAFAS